MLHYLSYLCPFPYPIHYSTTLTANFPYPIHYSTTLTANFPYPIHYSTTLTANFPYPIHYSTTLTANFPYPIHHSTTLTATFLYPIHHSTTLAARLHGQIAPSTALPSPRLRLIDLLAVPAPAGLCCAHHKEAWVLTWACQSGYRTRLLRPQGPRGDDRAEWPAKDQRPTSAGLLVRPPH